MTKRSRRFAGLLAVALGIVLLFSVGFIVIQSDHNCAGEDCPVCCRLDLCQAIWKLTGVTVGLTVVVTVFLRWVRCTVSGGRSRCVLVTPVLLKVKLSD